MKVKLSELKLPPVRKSHTEEDLQRLAADIKIHGLLNPPTITEDKVVLAGVGRILATQMNGEDEIEVRVVRGELTESVKREITICENLHRTDLSGWEKYEALSELMCMNPHSQLKDWAARLSLDSSMITRILSPSKCTGEWLSALKSGKVGISDCYVASKLPESEQAGLLALKLSGMSRDNLERHSRRQRAQPSVKVGRVKIALPNKVSVVLSGANLGMVEVVQVLTDALKEARKSVTHFDVTTWVKMMADKAKLAKPQR